MIGFSQSAYSCANKEEKGRGVFRIIKKVGKIESEKGKEIGSIDAWVYVSKEPFIVV